MDPAMYPWIDKKKQSGIIGSKKQALLHSLVLPLPSLSPPSSSVYMYHKVRDPSKSLLFISPRPKSKKKTYKKTGIKEKEKEKGR
jgi:hypothetical protein